MLTMTPRATELRDRLDAFMREHADMKVSHAICPECARKLMPA